MLKVLTVIIEFLLLNGIRLLLWGAALGLGTSAFLLTAFNYFLGQFYGVAGSVNGGILGLAAIAGAHIAISMVIGAVVFVVTVQSTFLRFFRK